MPDLDPLKNSERVIALIMQALLKFGLQHGSVLRVTDLGLDETEESKALFRGCCAWLVDEQIIRCANYEQVRKGMPMISPVITAYGFALLGQKFIGAPEQKLGQAVSKVAEGSASYTGIGDFIGGILGGFTKSISA